MPLHLVHMFPTIAPQYPVRFKSFQTFRPLLHCRSPCHQRLLGCHGHLRLTVILIGLGLTVSNASTPSHPPLNSSRIPSNQSLLRVGASSKTSLIIVVVFVVILVTISSLSDKVEASADNTDQVFQ